MEEKQFPKIDNTYNYLLSMKIYSFTEEKMKELEKDLMEVEALLEEHLNKNYRDLWREDLEKLKLKIM